MGFQDIAFLTSPASYSTMFPKNVVDVKSMELPPHVLKLWLALSQGMPPVKYFHSNKAFFLCKSNFAEIIILSQRWGKPGHSWLWGYCQI